MSYAILHRIGNEAVEGVVRMMYGPAVRRKMMLAD
jgi:hypothetical protein